MNMFEIIFLIIGLLIVIPIGKIMFGLILENIETYWSNSHIKSKFTCNSEYCSGECNCRKCKKKEWCENCIHYEMRNYDICKKCKHIKDNALINMRMMDDGVLK